MEKKRKRNVLVFGKQRLLLKDNTKNQIPLCKNCGKNESFEVVNKKKVCDVCYHPFDN